MKRIKRAILLIFVYLLCLSGYTRCNTQNTQFSNYLWRLDLIGVPTDINFINTNEAITVTNKGVVAKLNIKNGKTVWKKLYKNEVEISSDEYCK